MKDFELQIEYIEVGKLKPYERNNKKHTDEDVSEIAKSIEKYGFNDPIGLYGNNIIVEGHGRLEAAKKLGLEKVPCVRLDHMTDKERREYAILHNKTAELAEYDFDNLKLEFDELDFSDFDIDFGFGVDIGEIGCQNNDVPKNKSLVEVFGAPPFSIIDTRKGYWQDRKRAWREIGINSEEGRGKSLLGDGLKQLADKYGNGNEQLQGTSIFDPALTETMYKWFCPPNGKIFDCFAGGERPRHSCRETRVRISRNRFEATTNRRQYCQC